MQYKLFIVSLPIGNLEDITLRALRVLKEVSCIFAEDTREFKKISATYNIDTKVFSYHDFSSLKEKNKIFEMLEKGDVAIVSDRGTPIFNDPGFEIVKDYNNITVIPGASAILPAVILAKFSYRFSFFGFVKNQDLKELANHKLPLVFFVPPHDINNFLNVAFEVFGPRDLCICREITKIYEEVLYSKLEPNNNLNLLGELTVVIDGNKEPVLVDEKLLKEMLNRNISQKDLISIFSSIYKVSSNHIYNTIKKLL